MDHPLNDRIARLERENHRQKLRRASVVAAVVLAIAGLSLSAMVGGQPVADARGAPKGFLKVGPHDFRVESITAAREYVDDSGQKEQAALEVVVDREKQVLLGEEAVALRRWLDRQADD